MKRQVTVGLSVATLTMLLAACEPVVVDDDWRTTRHVISQLDRGYGYSHHHRAYDDGWRRGLHHRRIGWDDDDDDGGNRRRWNDDDD